MTQPPPPTQIDSWQAAERNAAAWMRHWGYSDAQVTAGGADGGVDVRSARALAQVKFEAAQVGAPTVQRLVGARGLAHHQSLLFFSGAGYARPAVEYADMMGIALFQYRLDGSMVPVNGAASAVIDQAASVAAENFPLEEVRRWADTARAKRNAEKAVTAGWWRRNGWLIWAIFCGFGAFAMLTEAVGLSKPAPGSEPAGWGPVFGYLGMGIGSYYLWRYLAKRRVERAASLPTLPDPGPMPAAARAVGARIRGTQVGATVEEKMKATTELTKAVKGLDISHAQIIVETLQKESERATAP